MLLDLINLQEDIAIIVLSMLNIKDVVNLQQTCTEIKRFIGASRVLWINFLQRLSLSERHCIPNSATEILETPDLQRVIIKCVRSHQNWINAQTIPTSTYELTSELGGPYDYRISAVVLNGRYLLRISTLGATAADPTTHRSISIELDELEKSQNQTGYHSLHESPHMISGSTLDYAIDEIESGILRFTYHVFDESAENLVLEVAEFDTQSSEIKKLISTTLTVNLIPGDDSGAYNVVSVMRDARLIVSLKSGLIAIDVATKRWAVLCLYHGKTARDMVMNKKELITMLKPDDEDGLAELSIAVLPLESIFENEVILGSLENDPPCVMIDPFIACSFDLCIPLEPITNTKFLLKGRGTRMACHGTSWLGSHHQSGRDDETAETISLILTLVHAADNNLYEYTHQHVLAFMLRLGKTTSGPRARYTLDIQSSSQLIPLEPVVGGDVRLWISPVTSSGRFFGIRSEIIRGKLVYECRALTLDQLWGSIDVAPIKMLSRETCKSNLPLQGFGNEYPTLDTETGAIALETWENSQRIVEVFFFD